MYLDYLKERQGIEYYEHVSGNGFCTYKFEYDYCYLVDIYVKPKFRSSLIAKDMADRISHLASKKGYKFLVGSIDQRANGHENSKRLLIKYDMVPFKEEGSMIFFKKDIK